MTVVDANVIATVLLDDGTDGRAVRHRLGGEHLVAPELLDLEVLSVIRRLVANGSVTEQRGGQAAADLADLAVDRAPHRPFVSRCWELRDNLSPYDAAYVALAESLDATLLTADARLARATGYTCTIELIESTDA